MELHQTLSQQVGEQLQAANEVLVTAESCTGGGVATAITDIAGSSAWFDRAFVTYSNEAKQEMIG
ncbi:CinA family protein, partial [Vibrio furnissii]